MKSYTSVQDCTDYLYQTYDVVCEISCEYPNFESARLDLYMRLISAYQKTYQVNQRLVIVVKKDFYRPNTKHGMILELLQSILLDVDISNFFVCVVTTNPDIKKEYETIHHLWNQDPVPVNLYFCQGDFCRINVEHGFFHGKINSLKHIGSIVKNLNVKQRNLLFVDDAFCIAPWVATYISPDSSVLPCCLFDRSEIPESNLKKNRSLEELWNSESLKKIRHDLLNNRQPRACQTCYKHERLGRDSLRKHFNREFAHRIDVVDSTVDGHSDMFVTRYWDIRYSNVCNFSCRSCNHTLSSSWYQIHNKIYPDRPIQTALIEVGDDQDQVFLEFSKQIDHVEKIYFAGGEPTMIENFYRILELLHEKKRHNVAITYNINLSRLGLKHWYLPEIWKRFNNISIGASLDGMDCRAEYLRPGTNWPTIVKNRKILSEECPHIDFYISATTGLINALHVVDFHRSWIEQGLIEPKDFNLQLLTEPSWMSVSNAPPKLKSMIIEKYQQHLKWLKPLDDIGRATSGFESIINLCNSSDDTYDQQRFWNEVDKLDLYHKTNLLEFFPELVESGLL